ncbi:MAG: NAD(P)/FAD-dependent oxidoreductase [Ectothiorhodospiraceae bacterium]|nr:NAD(P)/FAD-dependent oxidoreductase [Ectothiorhodospiraceae bacterium]MCH8506129.1 NAD(P)/FAD-dependent oxidoreductase [Ectothiorhodospiraceae bacterium]
MAIIGAGVAGLVTAKVLNQDGFKVTVFEKDADVGGVWSSSRAYPGLRTNNPAPTYAFSDFPHAEDTDAFPTAAQIRAYLGGYARHFGLEPHLRLGTEVVSVRHKPREDGTSDPGFRVGLRPVDGSGTEQHQDFDLVVVCNGVFSRPHVPGFEGSEHFAGHIIHSSQLGGEGSLEGKRVVVVGAGKSALDCASHAAVEARSSTLVFRRPYWMLPRYFFGRIRVDRAVFNRRTELLTFPAYHSLPRGERMLRRLTTPLIPLRSLYRWLQCRLVVWQSRIPRAMRPDAPIHRYIYHQGIGPEFYQHVHAGTAQIRRAGVSGFTEAGDLRLDSGETLMADVVVCATGWRQHADMLHPELRRNVLRDGHFRLYRHVLPPAEPRLGFNGYASSGNSPRTSEIAAHWLSHHFRNPAALPAREQMEADVDHVLDWTARTFPDQPEGHFIGGYIEHYVDWLQRDLEQSPAERVRLQDTTPRTLSSP